ncbi:ventral expressed homeobox [Lampris incognitus]|uniref:ventral expressed homeobox n=1 Tax=Lampris incognitus TaxID=2546036 RepID=UPI0024B514F0|nr:ventral expressed homeobox [Lampris incognitus]
MANNFSVEWLSKSSHATRTSAEDASPRTKVCPEAFLHAGIAEILKQSGDTQTPTSPDSGFGYTSGSESEVGDDSEGEAVKQMRRMRTKFTSEQVGKLESTFSKHRYLGATQRRKIAEKLSLSETQVKTWFQNRRMKLKREVQDLRSELWWAPSGLLLPPPPPPPPPPLLFQHLGPDGQQPHARHAHPVPQIPPRHVMLPACYYY